MPRQFHERPMDAALQLCPANACSRCGHERSCPGSEYAAVLLAEKGLKGHARALLSMAAARYKKERSLQCVWAPRTGWGQNQRTRAAISKVTEAGDCSAP